MILDPYFALLRGIVLEPTFGFPLVLSIAALGAWALWSPPAGERRLPALRRSWFEPENDMPSQMYYALMDGEYSRVVAATAARLDATVRATRGRSVYDLPWTQRGARDAGIPEARGLRRALKGLIRVHAESAEREGRFFIKWRFWLPREIDRAEYLARVDEAVDRAAGWIWTLEETQ